jgi:hypothetical protein
MVPAGIARDVDEQDTVANDGSFGCLHWKYSHSALGHRMLVAIVVFIRHVQVGQSVAPASSPPPPIDGLRCVVLQLASVSAAAPNGSVRHTPGILFRERTPPPSAQ